MALRLIKLAQGTFYLYCLQAKVAKNKVLMGTFETIIEKLIKRS
jgi:hypothetical protein